MLPRGFLGTRADLLMDVVFVATLATPALVRLGFTRAAAGRYRAHRNVLTGLVTVLLAAVVLFELDIRLSGGSGSLMRGSSYAGTLGLRLLTIVHVVGNVLTFALWTTLAVLSWRRFESVLPGRFSSTHRRLGRLVYAGTIFGAVSAVPMYVFGFVL